MMLLIHAHDRIIDTHRAHAQASVPEKQNIVVNGNLTVIYSTDWTEIHNGDCRLLCHAPAYVKEIIHKQRDKFLGPDWLAAAHQLDGAYLLIRLSRGNVEIARSLYRGLDVYYRQLGDSLVFSTDLSALVKISDGNNVDINREYCHDFIVDASKFSGSTPFEHIKSLQLGQTIKSNLRAMAELPPQVPIHTDRSPIDLLIEKFSSIGAQFSAVNLSFSGGLDSSVIFYCLAKAEVPFTPFHGVSTIPYTENELVYATDVASHFQVELQLRPVDGSRDQFCFEPSIFTRLRYPTPFAVDIFAHSQIAPIDLPLPEAERPQTLYLTGQGGDHVFLQNPGWNVGIDEILNFRIGKALSQISNYCRLKSDNLYSLLYKTIKLALHKESYHKLLMHTPSWLPSHHNSKSVEPHYLLKSADPRSAKYRHISTILTGLSGISLDRNTNHSTLHPLFLPDLIGTVLHRPVAELYTSEYDRILLRNAAYDASKHEFAWRQTKRSSASDYFSYFKNHIFAITEWLKSGILVNSLDIDFPKLCQSLQFNGHFYLNHDFPALINLLQLEAYIQSTLHFASMPRNSYEK